MPSFGPLFLCDENRGLLLTQHVGHRSIGIVSGRQDVRAFGIPISTRHASIPAARWSPHACRVVSRANIKPTDAGRCRAMQPSRESRSNSMSLRMIYRGAEAQSRCYRIRSIATNGRLARHPQSTPPTGPTTSPDAQPALKKWALSVFLRVRRRQCTLRLVKEHPPRKHERAGISCVKVKSRGDK